MQTGRYAALRGDRPRMAEGGNSESQVEKALKGGATFCPAERKGA